MGSSLLSGLLGLARIKYVAAVFGATPTTDAYNFAFYLPDMISYFLVGGVASITLVAILNRYRESGDEAGADRALSIVLNGMAAVLTLAIVIAEFLAPAYVHRFSKLDAPTAALAVHLTRIMLPQPLFFFAGGVLGARLLVRKIFVYQAITPLIYNLCILAGGVLLSARLGIDSLAYGVLGGALLGSAVLNGVGALRSGLRYTPRLNLRDPAFLGWLKMALPLMIGVSLAMADRWILGYFATSENGALTHINNAKALFNAPQGILAGAAGAASLPFFSSLFAQKRMFDFNAAVCRAVSRLIAVTMLVTAWMIALAGPLVDLLGGGRYTAHDAALTARYFAIFAISLALWAAQGIYARAFYAAGNTLTPAISGTLVTLVSIPIYGLLFGGFGIEGLAVASDLGILAHTLALAVLLHRARLVSLSTLDYPELARTAGAALLSFGAITVASRFLPYGGGHVGDLIHLLVATLVWATVVFLVLRVSGSALPAHLLRRGSRS